MIIIVAIALLSLNCVFIHQVTLKLNYNRFSLHLPSKIN